jgi:hypothetical protein
MMILTRQLIAQLFEGVRFINLKDGKEIEYRFKIIRESNDDFVLRFLDGR